MILIPIAGLVLAVFCLIFYNISLNKKVEAYKNLDEKFHNLEVLQDFMTIAGQDSTVDEKLNRINDIIIEKYEMKYSTIVVFNGAEYVVKASNVDPKHFEALTNLHTQEIFQDSVATATPKYITIENESEKLPYQKVEMGRAKSAMFFPLYIDNIYIGYWILESGLMHAFDHVDTTVIEIIKDNIISVLQTTSYQETIENIDRIDLFTGLHSAEYLYGNARRIFSQYATSAVCMFKITNIEEINKKVSREIGNQIITEVSNVIKSKMASHYVFVRYMGPKFLIVFSGTEEESLGDFLAMIKEEIEDLKVVEEEKQVQKIRIIKGKKVRVRELKEEKTASPRLNFVVSTYYKGTGLEKLNQKLEEYIDNAPSDESQINYI